MFYVEPGRRMNPLAEKFSKIIKHSNGYRNEPGMIVLRTRLIPLIFGAALILQILDPGKVWATLLVSCGLLWLLCYLWARALAKNLHIIREMRFGWAQVGDILEERFTLQNNGPAPATWVEVVDHSTMPGYSAKQVRGAEGASQNTWRTRGVCTRRGVFNLGPTSLVAGDPFGLYQVTLPFHASTTLMVMPPIVPLPSIQVAPGGRAGEGKPRSNTHERTVSTSSVREYSPGDSLHLIHWKTSARRQAPFVKIFDSTPAGDWWIILDMERKVQAGEDWNSTEEHAIILAASLADQGIRLKKSVGLVANGERLAWLPPQEGENSRWEILRALALLQPGESSLSDLMERTRSSMDRQASLIIITANNDPTWIQSLLPLIWRGAISTVLLLDRTEWTATSWHESCSTEQCLAALAKLSVKRYLIPRQLFDTMEARPGQEGHWEWKVTPQGKAIAVHQGASSAWRALK
jgi:uncharacterized protein (DUF58 family)